MPSPRPSRNNLQPSVCDPVIAPKSGDVLTKPDAVEVMKKNSSRSHRSSRPNHARGGSVGRVGDAKCSLCRECKDVARRIVGMGPKAVVIKGIEAAISSSTLL